MTVETHTFQAETRELLDLMIHSLYTHKEIFLRELISNASDALDRLRLVALTDASIRAEGHEGRIRLEVDTEAHTLIVDDNGIGMTREEVVDNIGTIARSGTRRFLDELVAARGDGEAAVPAELIGQFGVGFYSSFMVADQVVLETRKAGEDGGVRWVSSGDGSYTIEDVSLEAPGTRITLHLKQPAEGDDDAVDFTQEWVLRQAVKTHSDFVEFPIQLDVEREVPGEGDAEPVREVSTETLNSMKPLWTRPKEELTEEEYQQFYKQIGHDWNDPLLTVHFRAEGTVEYTALLYVPAEQPMDIMDPGQVKSRTSLYVKRVFVMAECEELMPVWLRFVRGVVDSSDLPLNVSRETLQHDRRINQIRKRLVRKVLDATGDLLKSDRERFETWWAKLGSILKEGLYLDDAFRDDIAALSLWQSTKADGLTTLAEYTDRMLPEQEHIYYLTAPDLGSARAAPPLEAARAKGYEVLLLTDRIDEWAVQRLTEYDGRPLRAVDAADLDWQDEDERKQREDKQKILAPVLEAVRSKLDEHVSSVRLSPRLSDSPAVLVAEEGGLSPRLAQLLAEAGQAVPPVKRVLELNPSHAVLKRLGELYGDGDPSKAFDEYAELVHGQALLAEGSPPVDPTHFAKLVGELMTPPAGAAEAAEEEDEATA